MTCTSIRKAFQSYYDHSYDFKKLLNSTYEACKSHSPFALGVGVLSGKFVYNLTLLNSIFLSSLSHCGYFLLLGAIFSATYPLLRMRGMPEIDIESNEFTKSQKIYQFTITVITAAISLALPSNLFVIITMVAISCMSLMTSDSPRQKIMVMVINPPDSSDHPPKDDKPNKGGGKDNSRKSNVKTLSDIPPSDRPTGTLYFTYSG